MCLYHKWTWSLIQLFDTENNVSLTPYFPSCSSSMMLLFFHNLFSLFLVFLIRCVNVCENMLSWTTYSMHGSNNLCADIFDINPLRVKLFRGNMNIYLHFVLFLHIDTTQVVEILPQIRQEPTYSTWSVSWLLMSWRCKEPGHQQPWYWPS